MWSFFIQNFWLFRPFVVILTCGVALYFAFRVLTKHLIHGAAKSEQNQPFDFDPAAAQSKAVSAP